MTSGAFPDAEVLPHIPAEMRAVASIRGATRLLSLSGTQVTKERLLRAMPQAALIHFAGHAVIDRLHPARSRLLIDSSSEEQDITAADIAAMKLDPIQLVYLSACRSGTAAGRVDGVESLAVAFIVAGAPSVVASRWDPARRRSRGTFRAIPSCVRRYQRCGSGPPPHSLAHGRSPWRREGDESRWRIRVARQPTSIDSRSFK